MACELIIFAGLLAVARAGIVGGGVVAAPGSVTVAQPTTTVIRTENYDPNPQYSFSYSVADGLTGDNKAQEETRNGDVVHGSYSLVEPDGSRRTVSYAADPINGFNAVVQKDPAISVRTAVASSPVVAAAAPAQILRPTVVASQSPLIAARQPVFAAAAPAAVVTSGATPILRQQAVIAGGQSYLTTAGAPLLRQSLISSPNLIGTTGIVGATPLGLGLGLRAGTLYGTQPVFATGYGTGGFVKVH